ncbi:MAG: FAD-dependent oxidoreductase, partial [Methanobacteriota archaeon]
MTEFSARTRAANLDRLRDEAFDVLVVGGGIVGAGVARDAACRGLRTALVERGDFASGTSGKTSRLIHGGLRYLRSYRVGLVRQAVRERDLLLARAPSLVHPLPFVIPAYRGRRPGAWFLRFGLFLYDFLSRDKTVPRRLWLAA